MATARLRQAAKRTGSFRPPPQRSLSSSPRRTSAPASTSPGRVSRVRARFLRPLLLRPRRGAGHAALLGRAVRALHAEEAQMAAEEDGVQRGGPERGHGWAHGDADARRTQSRRAVRARRPSRGTVCGRSRAVERRSLVAPQVAARSRNDCATAGASAFATRCMHISISTSGFRVSGARGCAARALDH